MKVSLEDFTKRYTINGYSGEELYQIFKTCVIKNNWKYISKDKDKITEELESKNDEPNSTDNKSTPKKSTKNKKNDIILSQ